VRSERTAAAEVRELPSWIHEARAELSSLRERVKRPKLAETTVREYERRAARLNALRESGEPLDVAQMVKRERYLWKAAGGWMFKAKVREAMNAADKVWKASHASEGERWKAYRSAVAQVQKARKALDEWEAFDFSRSVGEERRHEANHKKRPATDSQLSRFFQLVGGSKYRGHFLAMEFAGARPQEFGAGVRVEVAKQSGANGLRFVIEGAKCRERHGQPLRSVFVPVPASAAKEVRDRYAELVRQVKESGRAGLVLKVDAGETLTAGQKLSRAFSDFASKCGDGPKLSAYSLRNRFSAQAKASLETPEEVAQVLGHQSVETQRHYGRAHRGGGKVSPVAVQVGGGVELEPVRSYRSGSAPKSKAKASARAAPPRPRL
jgi:hypothetical protein